MKINSISARNFMGRDIDAKFTVPITVIVGRNMKGKTGILRAIKLALLGFLPGKGKTNKAIFDALASGNSMSVALDLSGTHLIERAWMKDQKTGSVKADHRPAADLPETPIVSLDARAYFQMTAQDRIKLIFATLRMDDTPIVQRVAKLSRELETAGYDGPAQLIRGIIIPGGDTFQGWIDRAVALVQEKHKENEATASRMNQTIQGLAHLENQDASTNFKMLGSEIEKERGLLEKLVADHAGAQKPFEAFKVARQQRARHNELMSRVKPLADQLDELKSAAKAAKDTYEKMSEPDSGKIIGRYTAAQSAKDVATRELHGATTRLRDFEAAQKKLSEVKACPTCKRPFPKGDKAKAGVDAEVATQRSTLEDAIKAAEKAVTDTAKEFTEASAEYTKLRESQQAYRDSREAYDRANAAMMNAERAREEYEQSAAAIAELGDVQTSEDGAESVQRLAEEIDAKRELITSLEQRQKAADMAAGSLKRLAEARQEAERCTKLAGAYKGALKAIYAAREGFIADAFAPLLQTANLFTTGIFDTGRELQYVDGELMRMGDNGRLYSMESFSQAEEAITYAAINAALGAGAPARIVLMDDMVHIDPENKRMFIENVSTAIDSKLIEQFIGADIDSVVYDRLNDDANEGWEDGPKKEIVRVARV